MTKKQLPTGIQTFAKIREEDCYYVDKTQYILELLKDDYIFLSRPRRFGKSLTLDTIAELFHGNKALFTGLYAEKHWDWSRNYPVLRFNFAKGEFKRRENLITNIYEQLAHNAKTLAIDWGFDLEQLAEGYQIGMAFETLVNAVIEKYSDKIVILIDEYDKPILDALTDRETALQMRDILRDFYSVIKGQDANIRFAMLTGVSRFSKINLFSGLNNLRDVTISEAFSALCGYTQSELESVFAPELEGVDLEKLKIWYNGYNWTGESVYNPFDILLFFAEGRLYQPYWFGTGAPKFLIDSLIDAGVEAFNIQNALADSKTLSQFDVGDISPIALMFQTGYLTIDKATESPWGGVEYTLRYPNLEVRISLNDTLLTNYISDPLGNMRRNKNQLYQALSNNDFAAVQQVFDRFFESIPYHWHTKNNIAHFEGYWASVFYAYFASIGLDITVEDTTRKGRVDMSIDFNGCIYIFEFKVIEQVRAPKSLSNKNPKINTTIEQIREMGYGKKYIGQSKPIYLIGVEFSEKERDIADFAVEEF